MKEDEKLMTKWGMAAVLGGLLLLAVLALAGCAEPLAIAAVEPTPTLYPPPPTDIPSPLPGPTPAALDFPLPPPSRVETEPVDDQACVACHTSAETLKAMAEEEDVDTESLSEGEGGGGSLPPMEAWEKVFVSEESFFQTLHGRYGCITCHGGKPGAGAKEAAHEGLVREPASAEACGDCHPDQVAAEASSLHYGLAGYQSALAARSTADKMAQLDEMMANHCTTCHTTCGQCHVSRPTNLGGGLVSGHLFKEPSPMNLTCTGCHGGRIENEYKGQNEGVPADVHWIKGRLACSACHSADEMHGALGEASHRYDGPPTPSCQEADCHPDVGPGDGILQHAAFHFDALSCQVCHSTTYKNCFGCHVALEEGTPYFKTEPSEMSFKIGLNPLQGPDRPWKYVPLRHVPVDRDSFAYYGQNLLPNFDALPTWKYATPHNIQRITPQNETCGSCHGSDEFFLTANDVSPEEIEANKDVIVEEIPFPIP